MTLELVRVVIDFGLVILIWMVQRVVYPSFTYYTKTELHQWHQRYTLNLSAIVMPLMFGQLFIYAFQLYLRPSLFTCCGMGLVLFLWISTFLQFVPLHQQISSHQHSDKTLRLLVRRNWLRTILWTLLFVWSCYDFL